MLMRYRAWRGYLPTMAASVLYSLRLSAADRRCAFSTSPATVTSLRSISAASAQRSTAETHISGQHAPEADDRVDVHVRKDGHDDLAIHAVRQASVARDGIAEVLHPQRALEPRGEEAAKGRNDSRKQLRVRGKRE